MDETLSKLLDRAAAEGLDPDEIDALVADYKAKTTQAAPTVPAHPNDPSKLPKKPAATEDFMPQPAAGSGVMSDADWQKLPAAEKIRHAMRWLAPAVAAPYIGGDNAKQLTEDAENHPIRTGAEMLLPAGIEAAAPAVVAHMPEAMRATARTLQHPVVSGGMGGYAGWKADGWAGVAPGILAGVAGGSAVGKNLGKLADRMDPVVAEAEAAAAKGTKATGPQVSVSGDGRTAPSTRTSGAATVPDEPTPFVMHRDVQPPPPEPPIGRTGTGFSSGPPPTEPTPFVMHTDAPPPTPPKPPTPKPPPTRTGTGFEAGPVPTEPTPYSVNVNRPPKAEAAKAEAEAESTPVQHNAEASHGNGSTSASRDLLHQLYDSLLQSQKGPGKGGTYAAGDAGYDEMKNSKTMLDEAYNAANSDPAREQTIMEKIRQALANRGAK